MTFPVMSIWREAPGTADRRCVDVDPLRAQGKGRRLGPAEGDLVLDVRSGEFLAGNFAQLIGSGQPGAPDFKAKIYWLPRDDEVARNEPLTVTVESLDDSSQPAIVERFTSKAFTQEGSFWPTGTNIPSKGRWRLTAEAPGHWGCFLTSL